MKYCIQIDICKVKKMLFRHLFTLEYSLWIDNEVNTYCIESVKFMVLIKNLSNKKNCIMHLV